MTITIKNSIGGVQKQELTISAILNAIYPVGSIYMSATLDTAAKVQEQLGGTWVAWGAGRVPVGVDTSQTEFDTVGKTGGEKTHTLTIDEMPSHRHETRPLADFSGSLAAGHSFGWEKRDSTYSNVSNTGGSQSHNNLQPYITCYFWKRIA